jgi:hypothetical protein
MGQYLEGLLLEHESRPRMHPGENFEIRKLAVRLIENFEVRRISSSRTEFWISTRNL